MAAKKIALYSRISTDLQSLDNQNDTLIQYVTSRFPGVEYVLFNEVASGGKDTRAEFQEILKLVKAGKISHVVITKLDRWSRSLKDLLNSIALLEAHNTKLVSVFDEVDLSTPTGRLLVQMIGSIAEFERALISARVKESMRAAKAKGKNCGRPKLIVDRDKVRELRASGLSFRQVAKKCKISVGSVQKILKAS